MSFHVVDLSRDPRRAQFDYFRSLANPYVGVTVPVDVTQVLTLSLIHISEPTRH